MTVKFKKATSIVKWVLALFMFITALAYFFGVDYNGIASVKVFRFMRAIKDSSYIPQWIAIFKMMASILLLIPKTSRLATLAILGYSVNIFLYCVFIAPHFAGYATLILIANLYLVYAYSDWFKPLFNIENNKEELFNT